MTHRTISFAKTNRSILYNLFDALRHNLPSHCSVGRVSKDETCAQFVIAVDPSLKMPNSETSNLACQPARLALHIAGRFLCLAWLGLASMLIEGSIQQRNSEVR